MTGNVYQDFASVQALDGFGAPDFDGTVVDLWLEFDDANDVLLNVYNFNFDHAPGGYYQSFTGATWLPNNLGPPFETEALKYADSFVTIGGDGGAQTNANGTGLDPNFGGTSAVVPGENAGWYNSNPASQLGAVVATDHTSTGLGVFIGRFSVNGAWDGFSSGFGSATWNQGLGTEGLQGDFMMWPTPGPLALLGVAAFFRRRQR